MKKETELNQSKKEIVPVWEKALLTIDEAAEYFNVGLAKIRELTDTPNCKFVVFNGNKRLIKRVPFYEYLMSAYSI